MRKLCILLIALVSISAILSAKAPQTAAEAANYLDKMAMDLLLDLQNVAKTPAAQKGDWQGIKPALLDLNKKIPAVYFWVLPDGNYYSIEKDFTNLNLSDRPYFKPLFASKDIIGDPIHSRSTGKKSAVFVTPIRIADKVVGAVGASVFLDDLHARLNKVFDIPEAHTWYAINSSGLNMLDMEFDYIFMDLQKEFSGSVPEAIATILKNESGEVQYEIGNVKRYATYQRMPNLNWWMVMAKREVQSPVDSDKLRISLEAFVPKLQSKLDSIHSYTQAKLKTTDTNWTNEASIRKLLKEILSQFPELVEVSMLNAGGILKFIEPSEYKNFENTDLSKQEHIIRFFKDPKPGFTETFRTVEGFHGTVLSYPVYDSRKRLVGALHLLIHPEVLVNNLLRNMTITPEYELWIMQNDGTIVYDQDTQEIGKNLFNDPIYAGYDSLHRLGKSIAANKKGDGDYIYQALGHTGKVVKTACGIP